MRPLPSVGLNVENRADRTCYAENAGYQRGSNRTSLFSRGFSTSCGPKHRFARFASDLHLFGIGDRAAQNVRLGPLHHRIASDVDPTEGVLSV